MNRRTARHILQACVLAAVLSTATIRPSLGTEPRFLSFAEELRRARLAVGRDADCRVLIEEISARCFLDRDGRLSLQLSFADTAPALVPRRSLTLPTQMDSARLTSILNAYGIPSEVSLRCAGVSALPEKRYVAYVGDFQVSCGLTHIEITHARRF